MSECKFVCNYWSVLKDAAVTLTEKQHDCYLNKLDYYHVPGVIGAKAYFIRQEGAKRIVDEGIITEITANKRNDSFAVKFVINYEDGLCIQRKEVIYGIDGFVTEEEARVGLALMEI